MTTPKTSSSGTKPVIQGIKTPGRLEITENITENWKAYKQMWNNYSIITNLRAQDDEYQVALFLHCIGPDALKIYNGLSFANEDERKDLSKIFEKFDEFTIGEINETYERYMFNSRSQAPNESIDAYIAALRSLAKTCGFCDCLSESLLRDRILLGINNLSLRKRLLQERNLDLKKCIDLCRSAEAAASHLKSISGTTTDTLNRVEVRPKSRRDDRQAITDQKNDRNAARNDYSGNRERQHRDCKFCGRRHLMQKEMCPAWQKQCQKCNGRNHFAKMCRQPNRQRGVHGISQQDFDPEVNSDSDSDYEFLSGIDVEEITIHKVDEKSDFKRILFTEMEIKKQKINFQIDCGASVNILTNKYVNGSDIKPTTKTLKMWNGTELKPLGTTRLIVKNLKTEKKFSIEFVVVPDKYTPIIGARTAQQMNLLTVHSENFIPAQPPAVVTNDEVDSVSTSEDLIRKYDDVFTKELGTLPGTVHLQVDEEANPVITPPRRIPTALKEKFKTELDRLESLGVLSKVDEPTNWVSSVVVTTKKSGQLRVCIDPRHLNKALKRGNISAARTGRSDTRAITSQNILNSRSDSGMLALRPRRSVEPTDNVFNPFWLI